MKTLTEYTNTLSRRLALVPKQLKAITKILVLFMALVSVTCIAPQKLNAQNQVAVSFQVFYDNLSPYGTWVDNSQYGYVWVPNVAPGFTPYATNGYWLFTVGGWTWFSNYTWGWAPFHYGRWFYDSFYSWVWVPGYEWGPSWVVWIGSGDYYGWAPIGPGISINFAYTHYFGFPYECWRFVRCRDFGRKDMHNYYINNPNYKTIITNSKSIHNFRDDRTQNSRYNEGPDRTEVEKYAGKLFTPVTIKDNIRPGENLSNDQLEIYRPRVQENISAEQKPTPSKVVGWKTNQPIIQQPPGAQPAIQQPSKQLPITKEVPTIQQPVKQVPAIKEAPTLHQPVTKQPIDVPPIYVPPTYQQPVKKQPTFQQPTTEQPAVQQPAKEPPVILHPIHKPTMEPPIKQQPFIPKPTIEPPAKEPPVIQQPPVQQPKIDAPIKQQPSPEKPTYQQPPKQPTYQPPTKQPTYQQPTKQPTYQPPPKQPTYQAPIKQAPVKMDK